VKVTLIDYGAGNVTSVARALRRLNVEEVVITNSADAITSANCIILPGVGHCAALITALDKHSLRRPILDAIARGAPFLGICLGLQAFYTASDEAPDVPGLGLLKGRVSLLPETVKLPHIGWNQVHTAPARTSRLLEGISPEAYFYFAHSYAAPSGGKESVAGCDHGREFTAILERDNLFGVQFHPEKSGSPGERLLRNFLRAAA
jgi:imidazole glycerol phosphate synthase glutamine amidotransferase subunit